MHQKYQQKQKYLHTKMKEKHVWRLQGRSYSTYFKLTTRGLKASFWDFLGLNYYDLFKKKFLSSFDVVNIKLLLKRLRIIGLPPDLISLIMTLLSQRLFYTTVNGANSILLDIITGTLQGSILLDLNLLLCYVLSFMMLRHWWVWQ